MYLLFYFKENLNGERALPALLACPTGVGQPFKRVKEKYLLFYFEESRFKDKQVSFPCLPNFQSPSVSKPVREV